MINIPSQIQPPLSISFGLSSILARTAASQDRPIFVSEPGGRSFMACLVMLLLAIASCIFGIQHPDIFNTVGREGIVSP